LIDLKRLTFSTVTANGALVYVASALVFSADATMVMRVGRPVRVS
jgi:hypothetical protein